MTPTLHPQEAARASATSLAQTAAPTRTAAAVQSATASYERSATAYQATLDVELTALAKTEIAMLWTKTPTLTPTATLVFDPLRATISQTIQFGALVRNIAFSPDGKLMLTASHNNTAQLWDVAKGEQLHRFEGFSN
jgi:hypothetical protein